MQDLELIANMAGNAFCASHYLPWFCALVSTYGKFMIDPNAPCKETSAVSARRPVVADKHSSSSEDTDISESD